MSTKRITELTDEQRAAMDAHADKWIAHGWSTEPADWALFEDAAERCYKYAGLPWHGRVVRVSSPLVLSLAAPIAAFILAQDERDAVRNALSGAVGRAVGNPVNDAVNAAVRRLWDYRLWGNLWTYWQAYNSYFRDVCGLDLDGDMWDRSRAYEDTAKAAGWSWPHREFVMVCDRPAVLHLEQIGPRGWGSHRLHCEDGPAIAWRDGYALYFWHGVRVSRELIEGKLTTAEILRERNAEVRRCAIEKMGWDQFLNQIGCTPVDSLPDPGNPGQDMHLYDLPDKVQVYGDRVRMLLVTNGTPEPDGTRRRFGQTVPTGIGSALAAQAWMGDDPSSPVRMTPELYTQLARRT